MATGKWNAFDAKTTTPGQTLYAEDGSSPYQCRHGLLSSRKWEGQGEDWSRWRREATTDDKLMEAILAAVRKRRQ